MSDPEIVNAGREPRPILRVVYGGLEAAPASDAAHDFGVLDLAGVAVGVDHPEAAASPIPTARPGRRQIYSSADLSIFHKPESAS